MAEITQSNQQDSVPLPKQEPLFKLSIDEEFTTENIPDIRHALMGFLGSEAVRRCVGSPVPPALLDNMELSLGELISNAHRPQLHRHLRGLYVWGADGQLELGVADDEGETTSNDGRAQTTILDADTGKGPVIESYTEAKSNTLLDDLEEHGLGSSIIGLISDGVRYHAVSPTTAEHVLGNRQARKVMGAIFKIPRTGDDHDLVA